ncbi:MAG: glycosyltransferase family 4 protein [Rhizobacter sp.]|nr:glycosyltransferase family 4 protein [Rhizobacter sp.]
MKIALCSSFVPFVNGGYRQIVEWLETTLLEAGHEVDRVYLPEHDDPERLFKQMAAFRFVDLSAADRIICFRPQSHLLRHPHKIVWFIHHLRTFYDLWDVDAYRGFPDDLKHQGIRDALRSADTAALQEARKVFTNSRVVGERLRRFNGIDSEVLYPPVLRPERFYTDGFNDEIVCICRIEHHKRQQLLVQALPFCRTPVRLRLCGTSSTPGHVAALRDMARLQGTADRLSVEDEWITEDRKQELFAECLASAYLPVDEDSYGYPTLEAAHSGKAVLTTSDAGGVLEFVTHELNGLVTEADPLQVAAAMDRLYEDRELAARLGEAATARIAELKIEWRTVLERLLA